MVYMFLDRDKMKKGRKQKSSECLNAKGSIAVRLEWLTVPLIGHDVLVPDSLGNKQRTQK